MATELVVLLVAAGILSVLSLAYAAVTLFRQARRLARTTVEIREQVQPRIDAVNSDVAVAKQEMGRIQDAVDEMKASRSR